MSHYPEYVITNTIQVNPQFNKSKRLQDYENAREKHLAAVQKLRDFELCVNATPLPELIEIEDPADFAGKARRMEIIFEQKTRIDQRSKLVDDVKKFESELEELKKAFKYDRKNSAKQHGRTLTGRSRKKIIHRMHFLYRKWREQPNAAKFLWYTFTFTGWQDFRAYNPTVDDVLIAAEFKRFLEGLKRDYGVTNYIWVAEPQTGKRKKDAFGLPTNAIHFHCVFVQPNDRYLHIQTVNFLWLRHLWKLGARTVSPEKVAKHLDKLVEVFGIKGVEQIREHNPGHFQCMLYRNDKYYYDRDRAQFDLASKCLLNPVDCEIITNPKKLTTYIAKYVVKNSTTDDKRKDDNDNLPPRPVYINPWNCTREIAGIKTVTALALDLSDYEHELGPHILKTFVITKELNGKRMETIDTQTYEGFPPALAQQKKEEIPDENETPREYRPYRKIFQYVRMILKETVFELSYFRNLMSGFTAQKLTLFA